MEVTSKYVNYLIFIIQRNKSGEGRDEKGIKGEGERMKDRKKERMKGAFLTEAPFPPPPLSLPPSPSFVLLSDNAI